jgi:CRP/FNR family cyclic AMP-dependent transcriptional regulator
VDDVLSKLPLFAALDDDANVALRVAMRRENFSRGDIIFDEGDQGTKLYAVIEGKVKLARTAPDGRENLQAVLGPGEMFGELSLFDPKPRTAGAVALTDTVLASLAHEELRPWITGRPDVAVQLLQALAQRLRRTNDVLADLVFSDVPSRVAKALLGLAERFGQPTNEGIHVAHDLTQEELAQLVGASRETVNKALADFSARGWIRIESRAVVIRDVEGLTRRAR